MTTIIGYTYEADRHCVSCTQKRFPREASKETDERDVPMHATDFEKSPIHPIFSSDEALEDLHCGDCSDTIAEA